VSRWEGEVESGAVEAARAVDEAIDLMAFLFRSAGDRNERANLELQTGKISSESSFRACRPFHPPLLMPGGRKHRLRSRPKSGDA